MGVAVGQASASVELVGAGSARGALVVHNGFVGHEEPDDVGELAGVAEVDRMGGALDDDQRRQASYWVAISLIRAGVGIRGSRSPTTTKVGTSSWSSRSRAGN